MISAKEAREKSANSESIKKLRKEVENAISLAVADGFFSTCMTVNNYERVVIDILRVELITLGYAVAYEPAKPIPLGCPSDQWHSDNYLKVSWED